jgi:multidrug efflux pump subunit AcrA (membrane-fusion protein)
VPARKRKLRWILLVAALAVGGGGLLAVNPGLLGKTNETAPTVDAPPPAKTPAVAVTVAPVTPRAVQRRVEVVGALWGHDEVEIAPKVGGRVVRIAHDIGDEVHPGDVLLEIDGADYRLAVVEAERSLELEYSRLGLTEAPPANFNVQTLPTVDRAQLLERNTKDKLARLQTLAPKNAVARDELEQAETDYRVAQANTRQAVMDAEQTLAAIRYKQAMLETARQRLQDTRVVVPQPSAPPAAPREIALASTASAAKIAKQITYVIAARMLSEGEMVHTMPPSPAFRLVMDQPLKLKAAVPERHMGEVKIGQTVELAVEAYPGETFAGTVDRINPTIDRASRTFQVEVHVPNQDRRLHAGSFVKAAILTRQDAHAPTVPEESLVRFAGVVKVFVVENGKARAVPVGLGVRLQVPGEKHAENWVEVLGPVEPGAQVVTSGQSQLADDTPVRIRTPM